MANYRQAAGSNRSRSTVRIPAIINEHINLFSGAVISNESGKLYNCIVDRYSGDPERTYVTARPSVSLFDKASDTVTLHYDLQTSNFSISDTLTGGSSGATGTVIGLKDQGAYGVVTLTPLTGTFQVGDTLSNGGTSDGTVTVFCDNSKGRGIHYWGTDAARYFVNDTTVYRGNYDTPCAYWTNPTDTEQTPLVSGGEKVYFVEWSSANTDYLFIISPAASQMFIIDATDPLVVINVKDILDDSGLGYTGTGAPFNASDDWDFTGLPVNSILNTDSTANDMCHGAVVLDNYLFLGKKVSAEIYNSNVGDFLKWSALDFLTAERENDALLAIVKSKDHVVALGERTTELMYDAGNQTGSPLVPRQDTFYQQGIVSGECVWTDGDDIYSIGIKPAGDIALYSMKNFQIQETSTSTINSYLRHSRTEATLDLKLTGLSAGGHTYSILTIFNASAEDLITLVFDSYTNLWYQWETVISGLTNFPLVSWSTRTPETPVTAEGIFSNGDLFFMADDFEPIDTTSNTAYFSGQYNTGGTYSISTVAVGNIDSQNISMRITLPNIELDTTSRKFMHSINYVGSMTPSSQTLIVEWSDDDGITWYSGTIDTNTRTTINRLGSFERRRFRLTYGGSDQLRLEALEASVTMGSA